MENRVPNSSSSSPPSDFTTTSLVSSPSRPPFSENSLLSSKQGADQQAAHFYAKEGKTEQHFNTTLSLRNQMKKERDQIGTPLVKHDENAVLAYTTPNRGDQSSSSSTIPASCVGRNSAYATTPRKHHRKQKHGFYAYRSELSRPPLTSKSLLTIFSSYPHKNLTSDAPHFELQLDKDFWKDHNVQVLIRMRPFNHSETTANGMSTCLRQESSQVLSWTGQPESRFTFDHVASPNTTQENLFQVVGLPMVDNCIDGYNSSIFAYGQTGSGKTHTMMGDIEEVNGKPNPHRGMTPRIFEYLFSKIAMEEASRRQEHLTINCKCSFLEIYNEQITDLLEPASSNLQIHEDPKKGLFVENLTEVEVKNVGDVMELLHQGAANRRVAHTRMNQESSRSHCVFTCIIESKWVTDSVTSFRFGRLNLVDLAGSERQKSSGAEGERLREAASINKSLSTLGLVIMVLVDIAHGKQRHVPYRDSKLTFLLQDSLGGNSKTAIIATVSPSILCGNETLSTLKFAQRAKFIQNNAIINEDASGDIMELRTQIQNLKEELEQLRNQTQSSQNLQMNRVKSAETAHVIDNQDTITESFLQEFVKTPKKQHYSFVPGEEKMQNIEEHEFENSSLISPNSETVETEKGLKGFLEEGNKILDEALQEVKYMNNDAPNLVMEGVLRSHDNANYESFQKLMQQICSMTKGVEHQIRGLCSIVKTDNKTVNTKSWKKLFELQPHNDHNDANRTYCENVIANNDVSSVGESMHDWSAQCESEMRFSSSGEECESEYRMEDATDTKSTDYILMSEDFVGVKKPIDIDDNSATIKKEERMENELRNLEEQLESSENQRLALEKLYKELLVDREEDQAKEKIKYRNLMSEVYERDQIFMSVKREMEIALTSLQEAEINRKKMTEDIRKHEYPSEDQKHVLSLEKELAGARLSVAHMQKQLTLMESGINSIPLLLEERLKEAEAAWHGERKDMCMQLNKVKIEAAERMCEANEALKRFEDSQEMIREAETLVTTLTRVNESARREKFDLITQWGKERESSIAQIEELKSAIKKSSKVKEQALQLHQVTEMQMNSVLETYDKTTSSLLEKLEAISNRLLDFPGAEDSFLSNLDLALCKLEEDAKSYLSLSTLICAELDNTLAEKNHLEKELERKHELLKGSMFDLSMLQESIVESTDMKEEIDKGILMIKSLQEDLDSRDRQLIIMGAKQACLEQEKKESSNALLFLETKLSEVEHWATTLEQENAELKQNLEESQKKIWALDTLLNERRLTIEELESEMSDINFRTKQKMIATLNKELKSAINENEQLQMKLAILNEKFESMKNTSDENKRLVAESQEVINILKSDIQEKEDEIKLLERSVLELEGTVDALESQLEILRRETEANNLIKEDLEMELQALRHQMLSTHATNRDAGVTDSWDSDSRDNNVSKNHKVFETQMEAMLLRQKVIEKDAEIKSLKVQIEDLISTAEKQASTHHQRITLFIESLNKEKREKGPTIKKTDEKDAVTSPFKCLKLGLARQISIDMDKELYSNRRRIDDLEELAASRQKEIFRLNKRLAEAETMTYEVIRDLLGVKSDLTVHNLHVGHIQLQKISEVASHHTKVQKEELEMLRNQYDEERASWLEDMNRRQREAVSVQIMMEKMRQKKFVLKAENKRLKADLMKQKRKLMKLKEGEEAESSEAEGCNKDTNPIGACLDIQLQYNGDLRTKRSKKTRHRTSTTQERVGL